ncbi:mechanosensitive ion channel family protein [Nevskia soli]|uniref:mechanosensitive ion channel family protein n=1 Tax=Nevskia soli TaxID=418856 RepID=UPI0015D7D2BB|nr:mechanosensitive ion channel family protein [Nevskia soli]
MRLVPLVPKDLWRYAITDWHQLILPAILLFATVLMGFVVRNVLFRWLRRRQANSSSHVALILMEALRGPIIIWSLIFGIYFALENSAVPRHLEHFLSKSLFALWIISFTVMATKLAGGIVRYYVRRDGTEMAAASLTRSLAQIAVAAVGIAILLRHLGISITPLVTALGVGGLAVALALQDTLGNLFGGFYITIAGQVRLGDYIRLNATGEEGYVTDISWRSTTIRTLMNSMVIVPNSKLSQAIVTNFMLPEKSMGISIGVGVSYDADPDRVEQILMEIGEAATNEIDGMVPKGEVSVRLIPGFGDSALQFQLNVKISEFSRQYLVQHELRKRILKRFREENIDMPFPTRTVLLRSEKGTPLI